MAILKSGKDGPVGRSVKKEEEKYTITITSRDTIFTYASYLKEALNDTVDTDAAHEIAAQLIARYKKKSPNKLRNPVGDASVTIGLGISEGKSEAIPKALSYLVGGFDEDLLETLKHNYSTAWVQTE